MCTLPAVHPPAVSHLKLKDVGVPLVEMAERPLTSLNLHVPAKGSFQTENMTPGVLEAPRRVASRRHPIRRDVAPTNAPLLLGPYPESHTHLG